MKCSQCGSKKHDTHYCSTDLAELTKAKCFACGKFGHIRANCREKNTEKGKGKQGSGKGSRVIQSPWDQGKGKKGKPSKGFGKKGTLNELTDSTGDDWCWYENDWSTYGQH